MLRHKKIVEVELSWSLQVSVQSNKKCDVKLFFSLYSFIFEVYILQFFCLFVFFLQMAAVPVGGKFQVYSKEKLEAIIARIKT